VYLRRGAGKGAVFSAPGHRVEAREGKNGKREKRSRGSRAEGGKDGGRRETRNRGGIIKTMSAKYEKRSMKAVAVGNATSTKEKWSRKNCDRVKKEKREEEVSQIR